MKIILFAFGNLKKTKKSNNLTKSERLSNTKKTMI